MKESLPRPTDAELMILRVLWEHGPASVRDVQRALSRSKPTGYTTALKLIQIMTEKGLVQKDDSVRPQIYRARKRPEATQRQLLNDLLDRAFGGSVKQLVLQLLASNKAAPRELAAIERLLDSMEKGKQ